MKKFTTPSILLFIFQFPLLWVNAQDKSRDNNALQARINAVENHLAPIIRVKGEPLWNLKERMKEYNVPGLSIAVVDNFQIDWAKSYGWADGADETPVTNETAFQAASISKTLNAAGFLKMAMEHHIDLNNDINQLLVSWKFPYDKQVSSKPITPFELLSHTAGLSIHGFEGYKTSHNLPSIIQILEGKNPANSEAVRPLFDPGEKFQYSGGGTIITQLMLSDITGSPYPSYMKKAIFKPLAMTHSFYTTEEKEKVIPLASGHQTNGNTLANKYNFYPELAAAGLWTTPTDLGKFIIELQLALKGASKKILSQQYAEFMVTPTLPGQPNALGVFVEDHEGEKYFQHSGSNTGFRCQFYGSFTGGKGVVIMVNSSNAEIISEIVRSVASVYQWKNFNQEGVIDKEVMLSDDLLKKYAGSYSFAANPERVAEIKGENGMLFIQEGNKWKTQLLPISEHKFILKDLKPNATLQFLTNESGEVEKFMVQQNGTFEWNKVE